MERPSRLPVRRKGASRLPEDRVRPVEEDGAPLVHRVEEGAASERRMVPARSLSKVPPFLCPRQEGKFIRVT